MINSYNDSFVKKFNGDDNVKSYSETFINNPNTEEVEGNYNRFFVNNTDTEDSSGNERFNPPGRHNNPSENNNIKRADAYSVNSPFISNSMDNGKFNNGTIRSQNYNAPFGGEEERVQGTYIRSFVTSNDENEATSLENEDFVVRNHEIDKEISLNNRYFTENNSGNDSQNNSPNNTEINIQNNIDIPMESHFQNNFVPDKKVSYNDMFETEIVENSNTEVIASDFIKEEDSNGAYKKSFVTIEEDNSIEGKNKVPKYEGERVDFKKLFDEENNYVKDNYDSYGGYERYRGYESNGSSLDQSQNDKKFFNMFFKEETDNNEDINNTEDIDNNNALNPYDLSYKDTSHYNNVQDEKKEIKYKTYDRPTWDNIKSLEIKHLNDKFLKGYFTEMEKREKEEFHKAEYSKLNNVFNSNSNKDNEYNNRTRTNIFDNEYEEKGNTINYSNNEEDRRGKINYSNNQNKWYDSEDKRYNINYSNNEEDRRGKINYPTKPDSNSYINESNLSGYSPNVNNSDGTDVVIQLKNKMENIKEEQYLRFSASGTKILRGNAEVLSNDFNNDTIKIPSTGIYRVDINIDYSFIVTEYIAGKDYQMAFTLEDGNKKPIFTLNKVAPTSPRSTYIYDSVKNGELLEVNKVPYELRLKLNNFSFSKQVPLDLVNFTVSVTKISR